MSPTARVKRRRTNATQYTFEKRGLASTSQGKHAFKWLLSGVSPTEFFKTFFEKQPFLRHNPPTKFSELLSTKQIQNFFTSGKLRHSTDFDITNYTAETGRETLNGEEGSEAKDAWERVTKEGCSIRLLRPQKYSDGLWHLCAHLEEFVGCVVGVNAYATPGGFQGFAPHFDDVDAFVCQIEGRKKWRVYEKRGDGLDELPRGSSVDFGREEMKGVEVWKEVVLEPGDMLYMPRGRIHEAESVGKEVSLHVTVSMWQKWTWADFLLGSFREAVESASREDIRLRRGMPVRFGEFIGVGCGEQDEKTRDWFQNKVKGIVERVGELWPTDVAGDRMVERFMKERLPPVGIESGDGNDVEVSSVIKAVSAGVARVVMGEEGLPKVVDCLGNSRGGRMNGTDNGDEKEDGHSCLPEEGFAVDVVLKAYPEGVIVGELPLENEEDRVELAQGLVEMGIAKVVK